MTLAAYLAETATTVRAFGLATGIHWATISAIARGARVAGEGDAHRIEAATGGKVRACCPSCGHALNTEETR